MRKKIAVATILLLTLLPFVTAVQPVNATAQDTTHEKTFTARLTLVLKSNYTAPQSEIYVGWTLENSSWATTFVTKASPSLYGYGYFDCLLEDLVPKDDENAFCYVAWRFQDVQPDQEMQVDLWFKIEAHAFQPSALSRDQVGDLSQIPNDLSAEYCQETYFWDYSNSSVQRVIEQVNASIGYSENVYDIVFGTINWFAANMNYEYPEEFDYPVFRVKASQVLNETLVQTGKYYGVCRHFADAYTAIMRGFGIPCKYQTGMIFYDTQRKEYGADGIIFLGRHAWCVVYLPEVGWTPIEVTIPDRYSRDVSRVGLTPYPLYYVPDYIEYTNTAPQPASPETFSSYIFVDGTITAEPEPDWTITVALFGPWVICGLLAVCTVYSLVQVRKLKRILRAQQPPIYPLTPSRESAFCWRCGGRLPLGATFCPRCGVEIRER